MDATSASTYTPIFQQFHETWAASKREVDRRLVGHPFKTLTTRGAGLAGAAGGATLGLASPVFGLVDSVRDITHDPKGSFSGFLNRGFGGVLLGLPLYGASVFAGLDPITSGLAAGLLAAGLVVQPWGSHAATAFANLVKGAYCFAGSLIGGWLTRGQKPAQPAVAPAPSAFDARYDADPALNDPDGPVWRDPATAQPHFASFNELYAQGDEQPDAAAFRQGAEQHADDEFPTHPDADRREQQQQTFHPATFEDQRRTDEGFDALLENARAKGLTADDGRAAEQRLPGSVDSIQQIIDDMHRMGPIDGGAPQQRSAQTDRASDEGYRAVEAALAAPPAVVPSALGTAEQVLAESPAPPAAKPAPRRRKPAVKADAANTDTAKTDTAKADAAEKPTRTRKSRATAKSAEVDAPVATPRAAKPHFTAGNYSQAKVNEFFYNQLSGKTDDNAQRIDQLTKQLDQVLAELSYMRDRFGVREEGTEIPRPRRARKPKDPNKAPAKRQARVPHSAAALQTQAPAPRLPPAPQLEMPPADTHDDDIRIVRATPGPFGGPIDSIRRAPGPRDAQPDHLGRFEPYVGDSSGPMPPRNDGRREPYLGQAPTSAPSAAERYAALRHDAEIVPVAPELIPPEVGNDVYVHDEPVAMAQPQAGRFAPQSQFGADDDAAPISFRPR